METKRLLSELGYDDSPDYLDASMIHLATEHAHILRRAVEPRRTISSLHLPIQGVYTIRDAGKESVTPVVYVAQAKTKEEANQLHKQTWNQGIVPFLLVSTPTELRLYDSFRYKDPSDQKKKTNDEQRGVLEVLTSLNQVKSKLDDFYAKEITRGSIWSRRGKQIDPSKRVDHRLLDNLRKLAAKLNAMGLGLTNAHALIGKYIYLRYLYDREIITDRDFETWEVSYKEVFGRSATRKSLKAVVEGVETRLNGSIFPLELEGKGAPTGEHIKQVASVFLGDDVSNQGHLDFDFSDYNFSYIPIETLSIVYEQFLALEGKSATDGAYYTPIPLVNFMLAEMDDAYPLKPGMRVLDPSCGSGAFLVQCYRRLIERHLQKNPKPRPTELRELLVENIFGVERNEDACRVTELNLSLTLLDSIDALSLRNAHNFKLPTLRDQNIFQCDFFTPNTEWRKAFTEKGFDWIIGNPPWTELKKKVGDDKPAADWINANKKEKPVVSNDISEAFAWETASLLSPKGIAGLLLPASSLFQLKEDFRRAFFDKVYVSTVANFANLVEVLFAGRARLPAAALFFQKNKPKNQEEEPVYVFSPMVANQLANQPETPGRQKDIWNIIINQSEIRGLQRRDLKDGSNLPWKLAMWGSHRDGRLLRWAEKNFISYEKWEKKRTGWYSSQGLELRHKSDDPENPHVPEISEKDTVEIKALREIRRFYSFPEGSIKKVPSSRAYIQKRSGAGRLAGCLPPHIVLGASRNYAVFRDDFLVVPPIQIGIAGPEKDADLLRALSLYLSSNFASYYEFFKSAQGVVVGKHSTLGTLRQLPTPLEKLLQKEEEKTLRRLVEIQKELVATEQNINLMKAQRDDAIQTLEAEYNAIFERLLGIDEIDHWLIHDLLQVRKHLDAGKYSEHAVRPPTPEEMHAYAEMLRNDLDDFIDEDLGLRNEVLVVEDGYVGIVQIRHQKSAKTIPVRVVKAIDATARELQKARAAIEPTLGQWLYFDRNLFITHDEAMYFFKPLQILWWTRSRGLLDSDRLIAEMLAPQGEDGDI